MRHELLQRLTYIILALALASLSAPAAVTRPFPQAENRTGYGLRPDNLTPAQINSAVSNYYFTIWKPNYLAASTKVSGDYKIKFNSSGETVSEAMGYGMLIMVYMAGADPDAKNYFDGLNRFRQRYPSSLNPNLMCWKIPANEAAVSDDCATDGDLDMAFALLLAHKQWGDTNYFAQASQLLRAISNSLVRADFSLRLGDWNSAAGQTRPSDFMPAHFRSFYEATGNGFWTNVENQCYAILDQLQTNYAAATGLIPDFATNNNVTWKPARPGFLEGPNDGFYNYNACRVPWRIGWAACQYNSPRARQILSRFMAWAVPHCTNAASFKAGYQLDGTDISGNNYDTACFISPTGISAMATTNQPWLNGAFSYAKNRHEGYYEDSVSLLSMLVMSGNAWVIEAGTARPPRMTQANFAPDGSFVLTTTGPADQNYRVLAATNITLPPGNWTVLSTGNFTSGTSSFTDATASNQPRRFYRLSTP